MCLCIMSFEKTSSSLPSSGSGHHFDPNEKICLVQLSFDQDAVDGTLFAKKVRICGFPLGIESVSTAYVKEICYPHLSNNASRSPTSATTLASLATRKCGGSANFQRQTVRFANLSYPRIDLDLARSLERFSVIVVSNQQSSDFISYYVNASAIIINIEQSLTVMMSGAGGVGGGGSESCVQNQQSYQTINNNNIDTRDSHTVRIQIDEPPYNDAGYRCKNNNSSSSTTATTNSYPQPVNHRQHYHNHHQQQQHHANSVLPPPSTASTTGSGVDVCGNGCASNTTNTNHQSYITTASTFLH